MISEKEIKKMSDEIIELGLGAATDAWKAGEYRAAIGCLNPVMKALKAMAQIKAQEKKK
jgi:hypothetical protein